MKFSAMRYIVMPVLFSGFALTSVVAQNGFCVMEWNVENLFDPVDNPMKEDDDFLPSAARRWTWRKFTHKLENVGKTIAAAGGITAPDIVALCEVENDTVLEKLTKGSVLRRVGYRYVMTRSADKRGINVALLYKPLSFKPVSTEVIRPDFAGLPRKFTRDVLLVSGRIVTGDTLDVFVCHFPSRLDHYKHGAPYRERLAMQVRHKADSLFRVRRNVNLIITGDFNDSPESSALRRCLGAEPPGGNGSESANNSLVNLMYGYRGKQAAKGTYCYKGKWELIDNVIVSGRLMRKSSSFHLDDDGCRIFDASFLLTDNGGEKIPFRTYNGMHYLGGFSDHLPLVAHFGFSW